MPIPAEIVGIEYTPSERRILERLFDGLPHTQEEVKTWLWDDMSKDNAVASQMMRIRKKIQCSRYRIHGEQTATAYVYQVTILLSACR